MGSGFGSLAFRCTTWVRRRSRCCSNVFKTTADRCRHEGFHTARCSHLRFNAQRGAIQRRRQPKRSRVSDLLSREVCLECFNSKRACSPCGSCLLRFRDSRLARRSVNLLPQTNLKPFAIEMIGRQVVEANRVRPFGFRRITASGEGVGAEGRSVVSYDPAPKGRGEAWSTATFESSAPARTRRALSTTSRVVPETFSIQRARRRSPNPT